MASLKEEKTFELSTGTTVDVEVEVFGIYDGMFGADADGNRGQGRWLVDSHGYSTGDGISLTSEEEEELDEKIEEFVYDKEWDFDNAEESDEDEDADFF